MEIKAEMKQTPNTFQLFSKFATNFVDALFKGFAVIVTYCLLRSNHIVMQETGLHVWWYISWSRREKEFKPLAKKKKKSSA